MSSQAERPRMIAAAVAFGVIAAAPFTIMPLLIGAMITDLVLTVKQAGYVVAAEMTGAGLAALFVSINIARLNRRFTAAAAFGLFIVSNLAAAGAADLGTLLVTRFITGAGSGTAVATVSAILAGTRIPERNFSLMFMGNMVFGMIAFLILPQLVFARWGLTGAYCLFAGLGAVVLPLLFDLPGGRTAKHGNKGSRQSLLKPTAVSGLAGMLSYFIAVGALWPFVEQIGVTRDLTQNSISIVLSATQFSGICGALLAAWLTTRFGQRRPIAAGTFVSLTAMAFFLVSTDLWSYALASILFYFAFFFTLVYLMGVLAALDRAGRIVALGVTMQTAGLAVGPAIAGEMITRSGYGGLIWLTAACIGLSLLFMMRATRV